MATIVADDMFVLAFVQKILHYFFDAAAHGVECLVLQPACYHRGVRHVGEIVALLIEVHDFPAVHAIQKFAQFLLRHSHACLIYLAESEIGKQTKQNGHPHQHWFLLEQLVKAGL